MNAPTPTPPTELPSRRARHPRAAHPAPVPPPLPDLPGDDPEPDQDQHLLAALSAEWGWGR
ncbi:MAG TPA: hypothetical protein VGH88_15540 [Streptosporangiaceae bacterium]|jgi:hypothetical protein